METMCISRGGLPLNPEEEEDSTKFLSNGSTYVPSSERQGTLDDFDAGQLECNGADDVPF